MGLRRGLRVCAVAAVVAAAAWKGLEAAVWNYVVQQPQPEPRSSHLAEYSWPARTLSAEEVAAYHRDGFVVVRGAFPPGPLRDIQEQVQRAGRQDDSGYAISWWWTYIWQDSDLARDFWYHSPAAKYIAQLLEGQGNEIRLLLDWVSGIQAGDPGHCWHHDCYPNFEMLSNSSPAASIWIPLSPVRHTSPGGALALANMSQLPGECRDSVRMVVPSYCLNHVDRAGTVHDMDVGDALLVDKLTYHRTEPITDEWPQRWTMVGRFATDRGVAAYDHMCGSTVVRRGGPIASPCHPRVYPEPEPAEVALRMDRSVWRQPPSRSDWSLLQHLRGLRFWFRFVVLEGWIYRWLWPDWKKCIFGNSHFVGAVQDPRTGRYR